VLAIKNKITLAGSYLSIDLNYKKKNHNNYLLDKLYYTTCRKKLILSTINNWLLPEDFRNQQ